MIATLNALGHMFFLLIAGHALADRPLQTDLMRAEKNRTKGRMWPYGLANHGLIHGGMVAIITGAWWLGVAEAVLHAAIDDAKCTGRIGLMQDQAMHMACKVAWACIAVLIIA